VRRRGPACQVGMLFVRGLGSYVMSNLLMFRQTAFNLAMARYESKAFYRWTGRVVSFVNVSAQAAILCLIWRQSPNGFAQIGIFVGAFATADFVNGWVHMHMDNAAPYDSLAGPFYAAFHLHHRRPRYRRRPISVVYYQEAGSKVWLALVELCLLLAVTLGLLRGGFAFFVFDFAVLSCVAEVSHYLCHVPSSKFARWLANSRLLLSRRHHVRHHREDNVQYAFLNGMSDPVLNWVAKKYYAGYKTTTDRHYATYSGKETANRAG